MKFLDDHKLFVSIKYYGLKNGIKWWWQAKRRGYTDGDLMDLDNFLARKLYVILIDHLKLMKKNGIENEEHKRNVNKMINSFADIILESTAYLKWIERYAGSISIDVDSFDMIYKRSRKLRERGLNEFAKKFEKLWF